MRRARLAWWCVVAIVALRVMAQPGHGPQPAETHGWFGVPALEGGGGRLFHLPPRVVGGVVRADAGSADPVRTLDQPPRAVAGWGDRVYLFFAAEGGRVEVYSLRVASAVVSGAWLAEPPGGATAEPVLEMGRAAFVGAAGFAGGAAVLGSSGTWRVWLMIDGAWREEGLPAGLAEARRAWLVAGAARPTILAVGPVGAVRWTRHGEEAGGWRQEPLGGAAPADSGPVLGAVDSGGDVCLVEHDGPAVRVRSMGPALVGEVARVRTDGEVQAIAPLDGGSRLAVLTRRRDPGAMGVDHPIAAWEVIEVSLVSGRELYRGPCRHPSLRVENEVRWLSVLMMALTVCVLYYLLRPVEGGGEPRLPDGYGLAPPGRRLAAGAIDGLLAASAVRLLLGVPVADLVLVLPLFKSAPGLLALAALVMGGAAYGTLAEWLTGRTLGKLLARIRVVSVDPARPRVGLMRTGARNVFRWVLAPWAVLGLGGPGLRHRGDVLAGAAVVARGTRPGAEGAHRQR